jgi:hypothetical protein
LADHLRAEDRELLQEVLVLARQLDGQNVAEAGYYRAKVLSTVAKRLDAEDRDLLQEALAVAR